MKTYRSVLRDRVKRKINKQVGLLFNMFLNIGYEVLIQLLEGKNWTKGIYSFKDVSLHRKTDLYWLVIKRTIRTTLERWTIHVIDPSSNCIVSVYWSEIISSWARECKIVSYCLPVIERWDRVSGYQKFFGYSVWPLWRIATEQAGFSTLHSLHTSTGWGGKRTGRRASEHNHYEGGW